MTKKECPFCNSNHTQKDGRRNNKQRYKCMSCGKRFLSGSYEGEFSYIIHFNTKIKKTDRNMLTRDNYCVPSRDIDYAFKKILLDGKSCYERTGCYPLSYPSCWCEIPNEIFSDYEHFTEEYVASHYEDCMRNFDLNMAYFNSLEKEAFDAYLAAFVKKNRFKEITDLQDISSVSGIYILVLDKYKQVYIGKSQSVNGMKARILSHWSKRKEFSRLIFGNVKNSVLPIDAFGALDTTRIYVREYRWYQDLDTAERKFVEKFDARFRLNRVAGGINAEGDSSLRNMELLATKQTRNLDESNEK